MTSSEKIAALGKSSFCAYLSDAQISLLASQVFEREFRIGEILIEQGDVTNTAFLITSGVVKIYRINEAGNEIHLSLKGEGEIVGEMSLLDGNPRSAFVQAIKTVHTLAIQTKPFQQLVFNNPQLAMNLLKSLVLKIREFDKRFEDVISKDLSERTLITLQTLAAYFPNQDITLSQEELSRVIGATRARVTEALNKLEQDGRISLSHKKIHLN